MSEAPWCKSGVDPRVTVGKAQRLGTNDGEAVVQDFARAMRELVATLGGGGVRAQTVIDEQLLRARQRLGLLHSNQVGVVSEAVAMAKRAITELGGWDEEGCYTFANGERLYRRD